MLLGVETDTQDTTGQILRECPVQVTEEDVRREVLRFVGDYDQIPPMYSALKVNGKKLYELAREGVEVERKARPVVIHEIEIEEIDLPRVTMTVSCSKGTYIRTLCHDIGARLGCGAAMESLLRTRVGMFSLADSLTLSEIEALAESGEIAGHVIPPDAIFGDSPALTAPQTLDKKLHNGNAFAVSETGLAGEAKENVKRAESVRVYDSAGAFIGLYGCEAGIMKPIEIFFS